jgi:DNA-binding MarR family transcriptional regulator
VRLTPKGKRAFDAMAAAHERWVIDSLAGLSRLERNRLHTLLGRLKSTMRAQEIVANAKESSP